MKTAEDVRSEVQVARTRPARTRRVAPLPVILDPADASLREWAPFDDSSQVQYRTLWTDPRSGSYAGVLRLEAGATVAEHTHGSAAHHIWVAAGCCTVGGRHLEKGSYMYVPAGSRHGIDWAGPEGCTLFYLYLRTAPS